MKVRQGVVSASVQDDLFLLDQTTGESFQLGGSGGRIWELLTTGCTAEEIASTIATETDGEVERVRADVDRFLAELADAGVISFED